VPPPLRLTACHALDLALSALLILPCSWSNVTYFEQRYFVCDKSWREGGSIFFYLVSL
jgi:hypothetical protein